MKNLIRKVLEYMLTLLSESDFEFYHQRGRKPDYSNNVLHRDQAFVETPYSNSGSSDMVDPHDSSSLLTKLEEVMSDDFFKLKETSTLAEAACLVLHQNASEIFVTDQDERLIGIVTAERVLKELPPSDSFIPERFQIRNVSFQIQVRNSLLSAIEKRVQDTFCLERDVISLQKSERVIDALEELVIHTVNNKQRSIPVVSSDHHILGVVSYQTLISYLIRLKELDSYNVDFLLNQENSSCHTYTIAPQKTLAELCYLMEHFPLNYILVGDSQSGSLLRTISIERVNALVHPLFYDFIKMPLYEIQEVVPNNQLVSPSTSLKEVANRFLNHQFKFVVVQAVEDKLRLVNVLTYLDLLKFMLFN